MLQKTKLLVLFLPFCLCHYTLYMCVVVLARTDLKTGICLKSLCSSIKDRSVNLSLSLSSSHPVSFFLSVLYVSLSLSPSPNALCLFKYIKLGFFARHHKNVFSSTYEIWSKLSCLDQCGRYATARTLGITTNTGETPGSLAPRYR